MIDLAIIAEEDFAANVAPFFTNGPTFSVYENTFDAAIVTAEDPDGDLIVYDIVGGADAGKFFIDSQPSGGRLIFQTLPDFETPTDANTDNIYEVIVEASDGEKAVTMAVTIEVLDRSDEVAPTITSSQYVFVTDGSTLSHALTANESVTWAITGGADAALFEITGTNEDELIFLGNTTHAFASPADADSNNVYIVTVTATDASENATNQTIRVGVTDSTGWIPVSEYTMTHNVGSWNNVNLRERFNIDWPIGGGSDVRVTFISGTAVGAQVLAASIGTVAASGDGFDYAGDQVQLTFDTGSGGFTIAANTQKTSDGITFTFDHTDDLIVAMWHADVDSWLQGAQGAQSTGNRHYADGRSHSADDTLTTDTSGYGAGTADQTWGIKKIEIKDPNFTGQQLLPSLFVDADTFFAPTVSPGAVTLTPSPFTDADTFFTHAITGPWTPDVLGAGLLLWLKGDSLTGSDLDNIATWTDSSGNGRNFTQATEADKPNLEVAELNGMNVVHFTGSNTEFLTGPSLSGVATSASLFYVVKAATNDSGSGGPGHFGTAGTSNHYTFSDSNLYNGDLSTARKTVGNPTPSVAAWNILSIASASADWKCRLGGTQLFTTATNTVGLSTAPDLGRSLTQHFTGDIAEVVMMNGIDTTNRDKVEGYLAHKWGITSILDAGHPYKTNPPTT